MADGRLVLAGVLVLMAGALTSGQAPVSPGPTPLRDAPAQALQRPPAGTAAITGTVVVAATGQPLGGARVNVAGPQVPGTFGTTDEAGQFAIEGLPAGYYYVNVSHPGFLPVTHGQRQPGTQGRAVKVRDGERQPVRIALPRGAVITGTVFDTDGQPAVRTFVAASRIVTRRGVRDIVSVGRAETDDRGVYRVHSLMPGEYVVCARPQPHVRAPRAELRAQIESRRLEGRLLRGSSADEAARMSAEAARLETQLAATGPDRGSAPVCAPAAGALEGIRLGVSEERAVDLHLQEATLGTVAGVVARHAGIQAAQIVLLPTTGAGGEPSGTLEPSHASTASDGRFWFDSVAPGHYRLVAITRPDWATPRTPGGPDAARPSSQAPRYALADITTTGEDLTGILLDPKAGVTINGRLHVASAAGVVPDRRGARVDLTPLRPLHVGGPLAGTLSAPVDPAGGFALEHVFPGLYTFSVSFPGGPAWYLASATLDGRDVRDEPFAIGQEGTPSFLLTLSDGAGVVTGRVESAGEYAPPDYAVIVYPADERLRLPHSRRIRTARPGRTGDYTLGSIPPGEYHLAAVPEPEPDTWMSVAFLRELDSSARRVTLQPGSRLEEHFDFSRGAPR